MFQHDWKSLVIGLLILFLLFLVSSQIGKYLAVGQEPVGRSPTGYFIKVEALTVPEDITAVPIGTFVLFDKDGIKEIWRENVALGTYESDVQLETAIDNWAVPYISKYERKVALGNLTKASTLIGQIVAHKQ